LWETYKRRSLLFWFGQLNFTIVLNWMHGGGKNQEAFKTNQIKIQENHWVQQIPWVISTTKIKWRVIFGNKTRQVTPKKWNAKTKHFDSNEKNI
jgi:hypothetical protein